MGSNENVEKLWRKLLDDIKNKKFRIEKAINLWSEYNEKLKIATTWVKSMEESIKAEDDMKKNMLNASMNTVNNNLEKFRSIQMEINAKSSLVEACRESANLIALFTENANGTRLTISELRERFKKVVNGIQILLDDVQEPAESKQLYNEALHVFTNWFQGKRIQLFKLLDKVSTKEQLRSNIKRLQLLEKDLVVGEKKLKIALQAGRKNAKNNFSVKNQLESVKEDWEDYKISLKKEKLRLKKN